MNSAHALRVTADNDDLDSYRCVTLRVGVVLSLNALQLLCDFEDPAASCGRRMTDRFTSDRCPVPVVSEGPAITSGLSCEGSSNQTRARITSAVFGN